MKKILLLIISTFALLTITGCANQIQIDNTIENSNSPEGLTMKLKSLSVDKAVFTITNNTSKSYYYLLEDSLEKKENNEWKIVPPKEAMSYADVIETLDAYSAIEITLDIEFTYGKLSSGTYRFIKKFTNAQEIINAKAEFNVINTY